MPSEDPNSEFTAGHNAVTPETNFMNLNDTQISGVAIMPVIIVETNTKGYAFYMSKKSESSRRTRESQMRLLALLLFVADQKQKSLDIMKQLFSRLMLPNKD